MEAGKVCSEKCALSSQDTNQSMSVKVEEFSNVQEEEEVPVPITWQAIKAECEVSCLFGQCLSNATEIENCPLSCSFPSVCLSIHQHVLMKKFSLFPILWGFKSHALKHMLT
jgi:hypothetical protein